MPKLPATAATGQKSQLKPYQREPHSRSGAAFGTGNDQCGRSRGFYGTETEALFDSWSAQTAVDDIDAMVSPLVMHEDFALTDMPTLGSYVKPEYSPRRNSFTLFDNLDSHSQLLSPPIPSPELKSLGNLSDCVDPALKVAEEIINHSRNANRDHADFIPIKVEETSLFLEPLPQPVPAALDISIRFDENSPNFSDFLESYCMEDERLMPDGIPGPSAAELIGETMLPSPPLDASPLISTTRDDSFSPDALLNLSRDDLSAFLPEVDPSLVALELDNSSVLATIPRISRMASGLPHNPEPTLKASSTRTSPVVPPRSTSVVQKSISVDKLVRDSHHESFSSYRPLVATQDIVEAIHEALRVPEIGDKNSILSNRNSCTDRISLERLENLHAARRMHLSGTSSLRYPLHANEILDQCTSLVKSTLSSLEDVKARKYLSVVDSRCIFGLDAIKRCGIMEQYAPTDDMVPHPDLARLSVEWMCNRSTADRPFRIRNENGLFTIDDLERAVKLLSSRPPRRINMWAAPQLFDSDGLGAISGANGRTLALGDCVQPTKLPDRGGQMFMWRDEQRIPSRTLRQIRAPPPPAVTQDGYKVFNVGREYIDMESAPKSLYKPTFVAGKGSSKQGWCEHCPKGGFFKLKNSGYLYHKNHEHGIFANDSVFEDPLMIRRRDSRDLKWEGLCGICYRWVDIDHRLEDRWGTWFRHYNGCSKEYDDLKAAILRTGAPVKFIELEYNPYIRGSN